MNSEYPFLSIIIPTLGREQELVNTVKSLLACDYPAGRFELLIIDQTVEHTREVEVFLQEYHAKNQITWFKPPEVSFASLTKARNFGIGKVNNPEIIIFTDDDVIVEPNFLRAHVAGYTSKLVGATVGRVIVPGKREVVPNTAKVGKISWFGAFFDNYASTQACQTDTVIGCNFSLRAKILPKTGLFDERFKGNALREDSEMSSRVRRAGYVIEFLPAAKAIHLEATVGGTRSQTDRIKWYYMLFYNNFLFYRKWAAVWRLPFFVLHMWRPILACWLWYGKGSISAFLTPWRGMRDGIRAATSVIR